VLLTCEDASFKAIFNSFFMTLIGTIGMSLASALVEKISQSRMHLKMEHANSQLESTGPDYD
jgi:hypothetical protein